MNAALKINYGPLEALLKSTDITEIMINCWDKIFVEHKGQILQTPLKFEDQKAYDYLVQCILDFQDTTPDKLTVDGILPEGFRFNITLPPLTPIGATLTIRKFSSKIFTLDDLVQKNSLSEKAAIFLKEAVKNKITILVSGGTGSGKTSFLNTMSLYIPQSERIVSIEDTQELRPEHPNWIHMVVDKNKGHKYSVRDCVQNSLRMRPDRVIIGECRGAEAYDFLQAINTGHEGSMSTLHANNANDGLSRLENLVTLGHSEIPLKYIRHQIVSGIDLVIQLKRKSNGQRQISEIVELTGMNDDIITRAVVFTIDKQTQNLETTGYVPDCLSKIQSDNSNIGPHFFDSKIKIPRTA